jgi:hypothetical protein
MSTEAEVKDAIEMILADEKYFGTSLNWAVNYCIASRAMKGHELYIQCLYILNNISRWRGEHAKEVRVVLKGFKG